MTEVKKKPPGATWHGFLPATDPIYRGGWNFLLAPNLKPEAKRAPQGDDEVGRPQGGSRSED
jgi:hypothetical protein